MIAYLVIFALGGMFGATLGIMLFAACVAGGRADDQAGRE